MKLTILTLIFVGMLNVGFAQEFQYEITYKVTRKLEIKEGQSAEKSQIDKEKVERYNSRNDIAKLLLKDKNFRIEYPTSVVDLYNSKEAFIYQFQSDDFDQAMASGLEKELNATIIPNPKDTITIMNLKCSSITIDYGPKRSPIKYYYSNEYKVDTTLFEKDAYGVQVFIKNSGALPLRIEISNKTFGNTMVYTAIEISKDEIDDAVFTVPQFENLIKF